MEAVRTIIGRGASLDRADVDTDQIIPARWMKKVQRSGYGDGLFIAARQDPDFVLNRPEHKGATILVSGPNFGCGSSREHAPWALRDYGFRAVVTPSFADIFRGNCLKLGLLPVELPAGTVRKLMRAIEDDPALEIEIDVAAGTLSAPAAGISESFGLDGFNRERLMQGLDDIELTLRHAESIAAHEAARPAWMPRIPAVS